MAIRTPLPLPLAAALERLELTGQATLPRVAGLSALVVARWLQREAQAGDERWPLLYWPLRALESPERLDDARLLAAGAWVLLAGGQVAPPALLEVARGVWTQGLEPPITLSPAQLQAVLDLDAHHAVQSDPALSGLRRALLAHCESAGVLWLSGPSGSGRRSLVRWAHAQIGEGPLRCVSRGRSDRAAQGHWALFEELDELDGSQLSQLEARLAVPTSPSWSSDARASRPVHPAFRPIIGRSAALAEVLTLALAVAPSSRAALILGEPGVGKEGLARALHQASGRTGPFHAVDLGAVPEELLESELFGHARGAFTGADRARLGAFRSAEGGTLLLDEVGNLSLRLQARLLRVLQERVVQPVGEDRPVPVSARVLAATNADLASLARRGEFREDLYQRLATFTLRLPPLRERPEDILLLARHLLARERGQELPEPWALPEVERALLSWRWPGNIRELESCMALAAALCPANQPLEPGHLGELNPAQRRPAPTLITGNEGAAGSLSRRLWSAVSAVNLRVPALADRPEAWRRDRILSALVGLCVTPPAVDRLVHAPWWGGFPELSAVAAALRALVEQPGRDPWITPQDVAAVLPELADPGACMPIIALLDPHVDAQGTLLGLTERFWSRSVVVGRVSSVGAAAAALADRPDEKLGLLREINEETPGFLKIGWLSQLPRVCFVITRGAPGLRLKVLGARAEVWAGPLAPGAPLRRATSGEALTLGVAAEIQLRSAEGRLGLRLLVAEGAAALAAHTEEAAARLGELPAAPTRLGETRAVGAAPATPPLAPAPAGPVAARARWVLQADERAALNGLLTNFPGGVFKSWVLEQLGAWPDAPGTRRLVAYLREAPNLADYLGRLYELDDNYALRDELREQLGRRADAPRLVARWPSRVQRIVDDPSD